MENSKPESNKVSLEFFPLSKSIPFYGKWLVILGMISITVGSASAIFLVALDKVTQVRESNLQLVYLLPLVGFFIGLFYFYYGKNVSKGNNLLLEEIHSPTSIIPIRMTPLVFFGTLATHLFGGSAGREGTAVQMGGSIAHQLVRIFPMTMKEQQTLIILGISAGFSSVFGTPLAAAIFAFEVIRIGSYPFRLIIPTLLTAYLAHWVCLFWGVTHSFYPQIPFVFSGTVFLCLVVLGITSGWVAKLFSFSLHKLSGIFQKLVSYPPLRPVIGGLIIVLLFLLGLEVSYLGLGLSTLQLSFVQFLPPETFFVKLVVTVITLGSGFKGGEVTPLFFIGASLGNLFGYIDPSHLVLYVGIGFISVFAGATNTPLACAVMGMELFGLESGIFFLITTGLSYVSSGHSSIYQSQRIGKTKPFSPSADFGKKISDLEK